jgi:translation initiation factor 1
VLVLLRILVGSKLRDMPAINWPTRSNNHQISLSLFSLNCVISISVKSGNENSFNDIINELDKESVRIIISKQIRGKFKKISTVITGVEEKPESLSSELKTKLGTGGTYKEGQIILQGDHTDAVKNLLIKKGFNEQSIEVL